MIKRNRNSFLMSILKAVPLFVALLTVLSCPQGYAASSCNSIFDTYVQSEISTIAMDQKYRGEDRGQFRDPVTGKMWQVKYFTDSEKQVFELQIKDGVFIDYRGKKIDSEFDAEALSFEHGLFVIDKDQKIFLLPFEERGKYHHSSLSGGQDIIFAGTAAFSNGQLREFSDSSGHYKPSQKQTLKTLELLKQRGVQFNSLKISGRIAKELANSYVISGKQLELLLKSPKQN